MAKIKQTENEVKQDIKNYLELSGYICYRINNTGQWNEKKRCYISHQTKGLPDLLCISKKEDTILFIETKATTGKPTDEQKYFIELVDGIHKVKGIIANSLEELLAKISQ